MAQPVLVDLRNIYRAHEVTKLGFRYRGVGTGSIDQENSSPLIVMDLR